MLKWLVFSALWGTGLFAGDVLGESAVGGKGSRLVFFGGMWMLACVGTKDVISGYQAGRRRKKLRDMNEKRMAGLAPPLCGMGGHREACEAMGCMTPNV